MADDAIHQEKTGGIFIPYDKLLQQQSDKLDKILEELREFDRRKLDVSIFDSFKNSYEQRHEVLRGKIGDIDRDLVGRHEIIAEFRESQEDIVELKKYVTEREAVQQQTRYYLAGGGLVGALVLMNLAVNIWQASTGQI